MRAGGCEAAVPSRELGSAMGESERKLDGPRELLLLAELVLARSAGSPDANTTPRLLSAPAARTMAGAGGATEEAVREWVAESK